MILFGLSRIYTMSKKKRSSSTPPTPNKTASEASSTPLPWHLIGLGILLLFVLFVRFQLLGMPLERDEGGFAYTAFQMLQGKALYADVYEIKPPLLYLTYALFMSIFGHSVEGLHIGLLVFDLAYLLLLFAFARHFFDQTIALVAVTAFAILSLSPNLLGFATHATHLAILPGLGGIWLLIRALDGDRKLPFYWAGILLGLAFLYKQQVVHFMLFAGFFTIYDFARQRPFPLKDWFLSEAFLVAGSITPYCLVVAWMLVSGHFENFWFYTVTWPSEYATSDTGANWAIIQLQVNNVVEHQTWIWYTAGLGIVALFLAPMPNRKRVWMLLFSLFMCLSVVTGFHFYQHYFVVLIPAVALLNGIFVHNGAAFINKTLGIKWGLGLTLMVFGIAWSQIILNDSSYFFRPDYDKISRAAYGTNPFVESPYIGDFIQKNTKPGDPILIACSEPQIGFYAQRPSVSGQIFTYTIVDNGKYMTELQDEFIQEVEEGKPQMVVYTFMGTSWLNRDPTGRIFKFVEQYTQTYYNLVGVVECLPQRTAPDAPIQYPVAYKWRAEAQPYMQQRMAQWQQQNQTLQQQGKTPLPPPNLITIWERKPEPPLSAQ